MAYKIKSLTLDAKKTVKGKFKPSSTAEREFYKALRRVAHVAGGLVDKHIEGTQILDSKKMMKELEDYAKSIGPWATRQSAKLLKQVQNSNEAAYKKKSKAIGTALELNVATEEVGAVSLALLEEQVGLIQSIPIEAGRRAQKIAYEAFLEGSRAQVNEDTVAELQKQLGLSTEVAISRAKLIAITETARANAAVNQSRAMAVGSNQYRWHNSGDEAVRDAHKYWRGTKPIQGMIFNWDNPPVLKDGTRGHPGTFPRCRCFAEPVFDTE